MDRLKVAGLGLMISVGVTVGMTGCGIGAVVISQDAAARTASSSMQAIRGSDFGGHAPLVGAHIYLVQPGTAGYGSLVSSILTTDPGTTYYTGNYPAGEKFPLVTNGSFVNTGASADQFVPSGFKGVETDSAGEFYITGDYTCVVGKPVILIGYGGSPSYVGQGTGGAPVTTQSNVIPVSSAVTYNNGTTGVYLTYTTSSQQLFYVSEAVTVTGATGGSVGFNQSGVVLGSAPISATASQTLDIRHFSIFVPYNGTLGPGTPSGATYSGGQTATAAPPFNPAAVNMAVLGNCPSSGNFSTAGNGAINYVYMNEVSTAAAAYSFAGFINTGVTNQTGNDEFHIGAPNTVTSQAALANAALTAANLYDIQGGNMSTVFAGEGHIGRAATPVGSGIAPQAAIDTIGNILASCVDSNNTYRAGVGTQSTACLTLFQYAQDNGVYDTTSSTHQAFNIAQAAFNMARFPQGAGTGTTSGGVQTITAITPASSTAFINALYGLPAGNVPFTPNLARVPNDYSLVIQWNIGTQVSDVQIDSVGNAWGAAGAQGMYQISPAGALTQYTAPGGFSTALSTNIAIDGVTGNVWAPGVTGIYRFTPGNTTGTQVGAVNSAQAGSISLDAALNQYIPSGNDAAAGSFLQKQSSTGVAAGGNFPVLGNAAAAANTAGICESATGYATLDQSGNIWTANSNNIFNNTPYVCRFSNAGALTYSLALPTGVAGQAGGFGFPRGLATDANDNIFFADKNLDAIYRVDAGSTTAGSGTKSLTLHGSLAAPKNVAIDGANTLWVANSGDLNATTGPKYGTGLVRVSTGVTALTPSYITGDLYTSTPTRYLNSVAIDASGNIWAAQGVAQGALSNANSVFEFIGLATPTVTPIAAAKANGTVGAKPGLTVARISSYGISANVLRLTAANSFTVGEQVVLSGFATSTFLNGQPLTVTSITGSGASAVIAATYTHADSSGTVTETGAASALN